MPLIKYFQYLTLPDGSPAADMDFPVQLLGGNVLVPVFTSKAGTTPLSNPVTTDGDGLLEFFAAPGAFYTDIGGIQFHYLVDETEGDDAWPGTFIHTQTTPATVWTIEHHFGVEPEVTVLVAAAATVGEVSHPDSETTTITFGTPTTGTALLRR